MKHTVKARLGVIALSLILAFTMSFGTVFAGTNQITLTPAQDDQYMAQVVDILGGGDGLFKAGLNGMDMYDHLGYVYMGWRTTGGTWQNQVIGDYIMGQLQKAGYVIPDANVEAPYGEKPDSDMSSATDKDYAWEIQYQGTADKDLGNTWDPEYSSMDVYLADATGEPAAIEDEEVDDLCFALSGEQWGFDPCTEVYQRNFADTFGMDYETEIACYDNVSDRVKAMHDVLMTSSLEKDARTTVDDFEFIKRDSIGEPNLEAELNQRTRLATNSCFTAPAGTDPENAEPLTGEFIYVGKVDTFANTNTEGIPAEEIEGKVILTDSSMRYGFTYANKNGAVGVASKAAVEGYLCPRDEEGNIEYPWYTSSRYAGGGALNDTIKATENGKTTVEWQFSNEQYDSLMKLLDKAKAINEAAASDADKVRVMCEQIAIGQTYPMTKTEGKPGKGQAVAIAEVKGTVHPEKRIMICAHVQEPGCNDNATGVASLLGLACAYKQLVDSGAIEKPKCTITFMWGDEMNMASYWMDGHKEEVENLIGALDMDMTGEDPEKTGGPMRIEKTPDPSADYGYTLDAVPWNEPDEEIPSLSNPYYDENFASSWDGTFVRLPDSHTLWGASGTGGLFKDGWYLNDLYMYATSTVIDRHDPKFEVDVCPYEGGSDHSVFLRKNIPSVLTWHFTDYTYHTSSDTLYMASPREMESVSITTLATALAMGNACNDSSVALDVLGAVQEAALKRMESEQFNTDNHVIYAEAGNCTYEDALANEAEVLSAWDNWYLAAIESIATLVDEPDADLQTKIKDARDALTSAFMSSMEHAETALNADASKQAACDKLDEFIAATDVPAEIQEQASEIIAEAKTAIAKETVISNIVKIATDAIKDVEQLIALDTSTKAKELLQAKIDYQDFVVAYLNTYIDDVDAELGLNIIMNAVVKISQAANRAEIGAAVAEATAAIDDLVTAAKLTVDGVKVTSKKLKANVKWTATPGATGYKVVYKVGKGKFKTLKSTTKTKVTSKKIKKGAKVTVKVQPYTTIDGKKVYGKFSKAKKVKIRK